MNMGMKEYKFLRRSRDLIVKSERKISRIDNKMSKIEQEVVDLKSKKKKLHVEKFTKANPEPAAVKAAEPVSILETTHDEIDKIVEEIRIKKAKYKDDKKKQEVELDNQRQIREKEENQEYIIGWTMFLVFVISFGALDEIYGISEAFIEDEYDLVTILFWVLCLISIIIYAYFTDNRRKNNPLVIDSIKRKFDLINQDSHIQELEKEIKKRKKVLQIQNKRRDIELKLDELKLESGKLINEKKELAKVIKTTWKEINHLVPKT